MSGTKDTGKLAVVEVCDYINQLAETIRKRRPQRVTFCYEGSKIAVQFQFHGPQPEEAEAEFISDELFRSFHLVLDERAALWPDPTDPLFSTNTRKKRVLFSSRREEPMMFDVVIEQARGSKHPSLVLDCVTTGGIVPLFERLNFEPVVKAQIEAFCRSQGGFYLSVVGKRSTAINASNTLLALRPDAIYVHTPDSKCLESLVAVAAQRPVVVGIDGEDPIDCAIEFFHTLNPLPTLARQTLQMTHFCYTQTWARRVCKNCARQTAISPQTFERIPLYLAPPEDQIYLFGRGCQLCGHASYRGMVNIDALVAFSPEVREGLLGKLSLKKLAELCYAAGFRTPMEDGLSKLGKGLTSYEEIAATAKPPTDAFAIVIQNYKHSAAGHHDEAPIAKAPEPESIPETDFHTSSPRVLVVEDDADQRSILELVFRTEGYDVSSAPGGEQALKLLEKERIDIIVSDLMMPNMSGEELLRAVKNDTRFRTIPFLMLTAIDSRDQEFKSLEQGADDYCAKTVQRKILLKRVGRLLERK